MFTLHTIRQSKIVTRYQKDHTELGLLFLQDLTGNIQSCIQDAYKEILQENDKTVRKYAKNSIFQNLLLYIYNKEKGMMKVATQSPIKEVPAKPKQTLKNFEKAHKTKTKKKSTQTAEKGNYKLENTSTKKKPNQPTQTKLIPNAKGNDKKIQSLKEKIAKLQRELQSQFDTAAAVMRKFKETKKKHDDKKITQKTSNAEAQPENEKKKTKVSQKGSEMNIYIYIYIYISLSRDSTNRLH
ncbi:Hypothetical_protein [Hexamita inflata]|uniref:Hypothetical_protein n=1 Tax=Hexamita inflata TaxID=28002 RepID=A0AA86PUT6_9EUKA|nr:Hypothetical protein HINF_LOCUS32861 [Hexamita inflata]